MVECFLSLISSRFTCHCPSTRHYNTQNLLSSLDTPHNDCACVQGQEWLQQHRSGPLFLWILHAVRDDNGGHLHSWGQGWSKASLVFEMRMSYIQWMGCLPVDNRMKTLAIFQNSQAEKTNYRTRLKEVGNNEDCFEHLSFRLGDFSKWSIFILFLILITYYEYEDLPLCWLKTT